MSHKEGAAEDKSTGLCAVAHLEFKIGGGLASSTIAPAVGFLAEGECGVVD